MQTKTQPTLADGKATSPPSTAVADPRQGPSCGVWACAIPAAFDDGTQFDKDVLFTPNTLSICALALPAAADAAHIALTGPAVLLANSLFLSEPSPALVGLTSEGGSGGRVWRSLFGWCFLSHGIILLCPEAALLGFGHALTCHLKAILQLTRLRLR